MEDSSTLGQHWNIGLYDMQQQSESGTEPWMLWLRDMHLDQQAAGIPWTVSLGVILSYSHDKKKLEKKFRGIGQSLHEVGVTVKLLVSESYKNCQWQLLIDVWV